MMNNLKQQVTAPENEAHWLSLRQKDVTSTEAAALFGASPYLTLFELWHRKKSDTSADFEVSERMKWGSRLERSIAEGIAEDNKWTVRPMKEYISIPELRMGSSFDYRVLKNKTDSEIDAILEIKNVDAVQFKTHWIVDGDEVEGPAHIEIQVQHQLAVSGLKEAYIGILVGGNTVSLLKRERNEKVISSIQNKIKLFWESIDRGKEPEPHFEKDARFIMSLYRSAESGTVLEATEEISQLASEYKSASATIRDAENKRDAIKAQLLRKIGTAEKTKGRGFTISASELAPVYVAAHTRAARRDFRIFWSKGE